MNKIVDELNKANVEKFGPLCEDCNTFEHYCRCESSKKFDEFMKTGVDTRTDKRIFNIPPIPEGDVAEYIKRITAYFKKPVDLIDDEQIN